MDPHLSHRGLRLLVVLLLCAASGSVATDAATLFADGTECSLAAAMRSGNADADEPGCSSFGDYGADVIVLDADVALTVADPASTYTGGAHTGLPAVTSAIEIVAGAGRVVERVGPGCVHNATGSGAGQTRFRLLHVVNGGTLTLRDLTLRGGCVATDTLSTVSQGGAILNEGTLVLERVAFEANQALGWNSNTIVDGTAARGGAVAQTGGSLLVIDSTFANNLAEGGAGHAGALPPPFNVAYRSNGGSGEGGAVRVETGAVSIDGAVFLDNVARGGRGELHGGGASGGALHVVATAVGTLARLRVDGNLAEGGHGDDFGSTAGNGGSARGGGLYLQGDVTLTDCSFAANDALAGDGAPGLSGTNGHAGIALGGAAEVASATAVTRCTFGGNQAVGGDTFTPTATNDGGNAEGGGLAITGPVATVSNVTAAGNEATGGDAVHRTGGSARGGGIHVAGTVGVFVHNSVGANAVTAGLGAVANGEAVGAGLHASTALEIASTLLAGNGSGADCHGSGADIATNAYNVVESPGSRCLLGDTGDVVGVDPQLAPLGDRGCATPLPDGTCVPVLALPESSIAVDGSSCAGGDVDARQKLRPIDIASVPNQVSGACDVGSFELAPVDLSLAIAESADPVTAGSGDGNLVYTLTLANHGFEPASAVAVDVDLPSGVAVRLVSAATADGWDAGTGSWTVASLAPGASTTLTLIYTVGYAATPGNLEIAAEIVAPAPGGSAPAVIAAQTTRVDPMSCAGFVSPHAVPGGDTSALATAVVCANASPDEDVLVLGPSIYQFVASDPLDSETALPSIATPIIVRGQGATLERAPDAGDVRLLFVTADGDLTLRDVIVRGGRALGGGGVRALGALTVVRGVFVANEASVSGGAIQANGDLSVVSSVIAGNRAASSGGGVLANGPLSTIVNSLVTGNHAPLGGALHATDGSVTLAQCTVASNHGSALGRANLATMTVSNTVVWGNGSLGNDPGSLSFEHSVVQDSLPPGDGNQSVDPLFVAPADVAAAPTAGGNYRLQGTSSAIDGGATGLLPQDEHDLDEDMDTAEALPFDVADTQRVLGPAVDVGAHEALTTKLFSDGFESGGTSEWSAAAP